MMLTEAVEKEEKGRFVLFILDVICDTCYKCIDSILVLNMVSWMSGYFVAENVYDFESLVDWLRYEAITESFIKGLAKGDGATICF